MRVAVAVGVGVFVGGKGVGVSVGVFVAVRVDIAVGKIDATGGSSVAAHVGVEVGDARVGTEVGWEVALGQAGAADLSGAGAHDSNNRPADVAAHSLRRSRRERRTGQSALIARPHYSWHPRQRSLEAAALHPRTAEPFLQLNPFGPWLTATYCSSLLPIGSSIHPFESGR